MGSPLRIALAILFVLVIGVRRTFERRAQSRPALQIKRERGSHGMLLAQRALLTLANLLIILYIIEPRWLAWLTISIPGWLGWLGAAIGVIALALLVWCHQALGDNFFGGAKIRESHQLVTTGPYRWVRHPMYLAFLLLGIAWLFLTGNWLIFGLWTAATTLVLAGRLPDEERMMAEEFGEDYRTYASMTGRFLPRRRPQPGAR